MTTLRTQHANLLRWGWTLLALVGLAAFSTPGKAQIPSAVGELTGTDWYYYTGSPWTFPGTMDITSQVTDRQGQWASLSGYFWTSSSFYSVSGTIYKSGWTDLYAIDYYWGAALHFYGWLNSNLFTGKSLSGNWDEYVYGQGYVPKGTFYFSNDTFRWRW